MLSMIDESILLLLVNLLVRNPIIGSWNASNNLIASRRMPIVANDIPN